MKSRVFAVDIIRRNDRPRVWFYRTNGRKDGGGVRMYYLTVPRLIRLLRAMVNRAIDVQANTYTGVNISSWYILGVVEEAYAAQAALEHA